MQKIVVVGGGTAGWMAAAALAKVMGTKRYSVTLVESEEIGTVGVGEATIPPFLAFNEMLGIDENAFMKAVNGTFKLGVRFENWSKPGSDYLHPFGMFGIDMSGINFTNHWLRYRKSGGSADFGLFNPQTLAARRNIFGRSQDIDPNIPPVAYAFHFDAVLYAKFLRQFSETLGVTRVEGRIVSAAQDAQTGDITGVNLSDGRVVGGDFFIDCSGFRGLLIAETLKAGYSDWSHWLPCNRAVAVPCEKTAPLLPYTRSVAREAGWQWRIPLQHRTGNGYVFCDAYLSEDEASRLILQRLDGKALADPRVLKFTTGHRREMWKNNVVALGLSAGFLEPLESTSIYLVQSAIVRLLKFFPRGDTGGVLRDRFNIEMLAEFDNVKDFLIAHYKLTERDDTPFWDYCRTMDIPDSLKMRLEAFESYNTSLVTDEELFREASWFAVLAGQGMVPRAYHPLADAMPEDEFRWRMDRVRQGTEGLIRAMPPHEAYISRTCAA